MSPTKNSHQSGNYDEGLYKCVLNSHGLLKKEKTCKLMYALRGLFPLALVVLENVPARGAYNVVPNPFKLLHCVKNN